VPWLHYGTRDQFSKRSGVAGLLRPVFWENLRSILVWLAPTGTSGILGLSHLTLLRLQEKTGDACPPGQRVETYVGFGDRQFQLMDHAIPSWKYRPCLLSTLEEWCRIQRAQKDAIITRYPYSIISMLDENPGLIKSHYLSE
jgi:hypothetical protein